jgi:hypothetical protein
MPRWRSSLWISPSFASSPMMTEGEIPPINKGDSALPMP